MPHNTPDDNGISPMELIHRAKGNSLTDIAKRGFGGWLLSIAAAAIASVQALLSLLLAPVRLLVDLARASIEAFFLKPLGIIEAGAVTSAQGVREFGLFGLLFAVGIVLVSFWLVIQYVQEAETTDVPIPGLIVDVVPFFGAEEESDPDG